MGHSKMEILRREALQKLDEFKRSYNELTELTSTKHWRTTGNHFCNIIEMEHDIKSKFTEITREEIESSQMYEIV